MLELRAVANNDVPLTTPRPHTRLGLALAVATVLALVVIAAAVVSEIGYGRFGVSDDSTVRLTFSPPEGLRLSDLVIGGPVTISPDGEQLAFVATDREDINGSGARARIALAQALPGTDGGAYPFWSPDSPSVGFLLSGS